MFYEEGASERFRAKRGGGAITKIEGEREVMQVSVLV